jgi:hypothetical protein
MSDGFLALACFIGSLVFFAFSIMMERALERERPPEYNATYALEKYKKQQTARWLFFSVGVALLAGAVFLQLRG